MNKTCLFVLACLFLSACSIGVELEDEPADNTDNESSSVRSERMYSENDCPCGTSCTEVFNCTSCACSGDIQGGNVQTND